MTENQNTPFVPPAYPQQPAQYPVQPAPFGQAPYTGHPTHAQGTYPPQVHPAQAPYPQQYAQASQWGYPLAPATPKSSGARVASGVVALVLGVWLVMSSMIGISLGTAFASFLTLLVAVFTIAAGIVLLAKQRERQRWVPITLLSLAGAGLLLSLASPGQFVITFILSAPIFIVMGIGLWRETQGR
ncbi:hypothetical protein AB0323_06320 [Arthrobacter sp. NPDC080031]|uniref:hypothetical protein n=1 Tax=Arthrobacter sp. NPDC080031 TaxID=3155918 RepID=UPI00344D32BE